MCKGLKVVYNNTDCEIMELSLRLTLTFGLAAVLAFIACPAGTEAQFINKMLKFCTNA